VWAGATLGLWLASAGALDGQAEAPLTLYMPDGQLASHSVRVYVTRDIPAAAGPKLQLFGDNAVIKAPSGSADGLWEPRLVAPGQTWNEPGPDGTTQVARTGTLLLFDLSTIAFDGRAMRRLMPVVKWADETQVVVGQGEINLGSTMWAGLWTSALIVAALVMVLLLSWSRVAPWAPIQLLTGVDGHLSLAQVQVALWTVAVGSIVLAYGLVRLKIPDIPESLLVLMGASLATGGIGFFQDAQTQRAAAAAGAPILQVGSWHLSDLLRVFTPGAGQQPGELSMAKAQMLFWTVILIVLFVVKSVLEGDIWTVPWELVALMGFSQAGYLAPKLTQ
jgi:hypothetical protein